ncbi:MAG: haloacid dehalogenase type II, partial [Thermomicrobiales bacterium]
MPRVILFDVNETLLDLAALDPVFQQIFGDPSIRRAWFQQMLQSALVGTATHAYSDFSAVAIAALEMTAARQGHQLTGEDRAAVRDGMR